MPFPRKPRLLPVVAIILAAGWIGPAPAEAGVAVIANRTADKVDFAIVQADGTTHQHSLAPRDVVPIPVTAKVGINFDAKGEAKQFLLRSNSVYYFVTRNAELKFALLALPPTKHGEDLPVPVATDRPLPSLYTVSVMLLADDNEPVVRRLWEKRLRERLAKASDIFEHHCRVRFAVAAADTWTSDDGLYTFEDTLREFESAVDPAPARVAIGFTSQYRISKGRTHLGGTRGPLHSHILIREWARHVTEPERLEVLVHELGHFLGATHSAEYDSVMRPILGDHRSHARSFRIGFDPVNTMIMYLMGEELRRGLRFRGFWGLPLSTRAHLRRAYAAMAEAMPQDKSSKNYIKLLDNSPRIRWRPAKKQPASPDRKHGSGH